VLLILKDLTVAWALALLTEGFNEVNPSLAKADRDSTVGLGG
jgi:hypothetical protein